MTRNTKIILGIICGIVLLFSTIVVGAVFVMNYFNKNIAGKMVIVDPVKAAKAAQSMIDYDLPSGYREQCFVNMLVTKIVIIGPIQKGGISQPSIAFMQVPDGSKTDDDQFRSQMQQSTGKGNYNVKLVDEEKYTIRGQDTSLYIYEGTDKNGEQVRQVISGRFTGKEGNIILFITGPIQNWNSEEIGRFIGSIR